MADPICVRSMFSWLVGNDAGVPAPSADSVGLCSQRAPDELPVGRNDDYHPSISEGPAEVARRARRELPRSRTHELKKELTVSARAF